MKAVKILAILAVIYVAIVVIFESLLGYAQPQNEGTLVLTVTNDAGEAHARVLSRIEHNDQLYVAVNHWPRAWYQQALDNPEVSLTLEDGPADYLAVQLSDAEAAKVDAAYSLPLFFRVLTGFPPRYILRLDPN